MTNVELIERASSIMKISDLSERLHAFNILHTQCPPASRPFIELYIQKTKTKAYQQLPF